MNNLEQHFKKHTESIRMTEAEKNAMRLSVQQEINTPSFDVPKQVSTRTPSPYVWMFAPRMFASLGVLLLIVISTGSAYAAEGALPGATLYPVKTKIIEPLKIALAPTIQAKAQANANIAATRVQEAQTLAAQGTLTPEAVKEISDNYTVHAQAALALAADVDEQNGTPYTDDSHDSGHHENTGDEVVAVSVPPSEGTTTAVVSVNTPVPVTFSASLATEPEENDDHATSSDSGFSERGATMRPMLSAQKVASTTHPVSVSSAKISATATTTKQDGSRSFVRTLRTSLTAQAEILQKLDAQVRSDKGGRGED